MKDTYESGKKDPPLMTKVLLVSIGAIVGANLRYWLSVWFAAHTVSPVGPLPTLFINITGSFLLGCLVAGSEKPAPAPHWMLLFFGTGLLGSFTTFSTFSVETFNLLRTGDFITAFIYVAISVIASITGVALAFHMVQRLL